MVPLSPDLGGCEHTTRSAHITESSLSSTVSSSSRDTGNTGNSATCVVVELAFVLDPSLLRRPYFQSNCADSHSFQSSYLPLKVKQMCVLTSTPRLSRSLVTSFLAHGIWLTLVLGHSSVDSLNDIRSDGSSEDLYNPNQLNSPQDPILSTSSIHSSSRLPYLWERVSRTAGRAIGGQDGDSRTGSHLEGLMTLS